MEVLLRILPALLLALLPIACGDVADTPLSPSEASLNQGRGGGPGGGDSGTLEWYAEFNDVNLGTSLDIKIYHYDYHSVGDASGSGTYQLLSANKKGRLDVDGATGDVAAPNDPPDQVTGVTNKGNTFTLYLNTSTDDCAPTVAGTQYEAQLEIPGEQVSETFCGNVTVRTY